MITLIHFPPALGLPDASPFVVKVMVLLKLAGQPYRSERQLCRAKRLPHTKSSPCLSKNKAKIYHILSEMSMILA